MQILKEIYHSSNLDPLPNPDLLFLSADGETDRNENVAECRGGNGSEISLKVGRPPATSVGEHTEE